MNRQIKDLMAKARMMQESMAALQEELSGMRIEGSSGPVKAVVDGQGELLEIVISPDVFGAGDVSILEDLVLAAVRDAVAGSRDYSARRFAELGLPGPGGLM